MTTKTTKTKRKRGMQRALALLAMLPALLAVRVVDAGDSDFKSGVFDPPSAAPDFQLQGSNGSPVVLSKFRGKVVAIAFGFSYCQRICPVTLANLSAVFKQLGAAAADVQVIFVSVDPDRDTPDRLREYLQSFNPSFLGATGKKPQIDAVRQAYGVFAEKTPSENKKIGYEVHHSSSIFLIDRDGKLRVLVPFGRSPQTILNDVNLLLKK
jgi:protein SCO1/2